MHSFFKCSRQAVAGGCVCTTTVSKGLITPRDRVSGSDPDLLSAFVLWDATGVWNNIVLFNLVRPTDSTSLMHYLAPGVGFLVTFAAASLLLGLLVFLKRRHWPLLGQWHYLAVGLILTCLCGKVFHNNYLVWLLPVLGTYALALICGLVIPRLPRLTDGGVQED